jgi:xanthine/uracil permease
MPVIEEDEHASKFIHLTDPLACITAVLSMEMIEIKTTLFYLIYLVTAVPVGYMSLNTKSQRNPIDIPKHKLGNWPGLMWLSQQFSWSHIISVLNFSLVNCTEKGGFFLILFSILFCFCLKGHTTTKDNFFCDKYLNNSKSIFENKIQLVQYSGWKR